MTGPDVETQLCKRAHMLARAKIEYSAADGDGGKRAQNVIRDSQRHVAHTPELTRIASDGLTSTLLPRPSPCPPFGSIRDQTDSARASINSGWQLSALVTS